MMVSPQQLMINDGKSTAAHDYNGKSTAAHDNNGESTAAHDL